MTAGNSPRGQPGAAQRAMPLDRFNGICRAAWIITARRREQRRKRHLIAANHQYENRAHRCYTSKARRSVHLVRRGEPDGNRHNVVAQRRQCGGVRLASRPNRDVGRSVLPEHRQQLDADQFAKAALESVSVHRRVSVTWNDDANTRMRERGSEGSDIEMHGPNSLPLSNDSLQVEAPRQPMATRKTEVLVRRLRTCLAT